MIIIQFSINQTKLTEVPEQKIYRVALVKPETCINELHAIYKL